MIKNISTLIKGIIMQIIAEVMFGLSFLFTKEATASAKPLQLLSWRFTLAAVLFWILIKIGLFKADFRGKNLNGAPVLGLLHPIFYFLCENKGIALTSASESGTIIATVPIFALLFSIVFLKIKPDRNQTAGIFITLAGVLILVLSRGSQPTFNLLGYLLLFGAVIAYGLFAVKSVQTESFSSVEKAVIMIFSGAVFFTAAAVVTELAGGDHNIDLCSCGCDIPARVIFPAAGDRHTADHRGGIHCQPRQRRQCLKSQRIKPFPDNSGSPA